MHKSIIRGALASVALAAFYLAAIPAQAASSSWNTTNTIDPSSTSPTQPSTCNTQSATGTSSGPTGTGTTFCVTTSANNPNANNLQNQGLVSNSQNVANGNLPQVVYGNQYTFTNSSGLVLQAGAFYLNSNAGTSTFNLANLEAYTPGLGVTSKTTSTSTEEVGNSPGHTMDNQGVIDAILFKLPSSTYDVTSITLSQFGTTNNFNYFIGSASALASIASLNGVALSSLTTANGWTAGGQVAGANGTPTTINTAGVTGQYLLVTAALNGTTDDIKIAGLGGQSSTRVAEPSTLAMFATAGLIALRGRRRKKAA